MSENLSVEYIEPLRRAWNRMVLILFKPFEMGKWFALGFTAWLGTLLEGAGGNFNYSFNENAGSAGFEDLMNGWSDALEEHAVIIIAVLIAIAMAVFVVSLLLSWVQARGRFMFLDNVAENRALVKEPWANFRREANTLFVWNICYGFAMLIVFMILIGVCILTLYPYIHAGKRPLLPVVGISLAAVAGILLLIVNAYVLTFLNDFVLPIMRFEKLTVIPGWRRFMSVFRRRPASFFLYGLFKAGVNIVAGMAVMGLIIATCCLASCVLAIPYLGTVAMLPVLVFYRALGPEFLAQFDPNWKMPDIGNTAVSLSATTKLNEEKDHD